MPTAAVCRSLEVDKDKGAENESISNAPDEVEVRKEQGASGGTGSDTVVALITKYDLRVFKPSTYRFDPRTIDLLDDFFERGLSDGGPTLDMGKIVYAPLTTKRVRVSRELAKMAKFKKVLIRILMPDRYSLQGLFTPRSSVKDLHDFVRSCLRDTIMPTIEFHLYVVPPKMLLKNICGALCGPRSSFRQRKCVAGDQRRKCTTNHARNAKRRIIRASRRSAGALGRTQRPTCDIARFNTIPIYWFCIETRYWY